jgi:anaerobic selenocysteine-containing dehydrogenase
MASMPGPGVVVQHLGGQPHQPANKARHLRAEGGMRALNVSHVANPALDFDTPSRKIEFFSAQAARLGLPPLPSYAGPALQSPRAVPEFPLALTQGRTLAHFHAFYNNGQTLPTLAGLETEPILWLAPSDAAKRKVADRSAIRVFNARGDLRARARVTDRIPEGTVWMRDGWPDLNRLTGGAPVLPDAAVDLFAFSAGQAAFDALVDVAAADACAAFS